MNFKINISYCFIPLSIIGFNYSFVNSSAFLWFAPKLIAREINSLPILGSGKCTINLISLNKNDKKYTLNIYFLPIPYNQNMQKLF